jgi:ankyrin repeat protein
MLRRLATARALSAVAEDEQEFAIHQFWVYEHSLRQSLETQQLLEFEPLRAEITIDPQWTSSGGLRGPDSVVGSEFNWRFMNPEKKASLQSAKFAALVAAVRSNDCHTVMQMIGEGVQVDTLVNGTRSLLNIAAAQGNIEIVRALVHAGANVNSQDSYSKRTPLHHAARRDKAHIVNLLLHFAADASLRDVTGRTALEASCVDTCSPASVFQSLFEHTHGDNAALSAEVGRCLCLASGAGKTDLVQYLVRVYSASVADSFDEEGNTPFHLACRQGQVETARYLLTQNADLHAVNSLNATPLHLAVCRENNDEVIALLKNAGADINFSANVPRQTPFTMAALCGNEQSLRQLMTLKVDLGPALAVENVHMETCSEYRVLHMLKTKRTPPPSMAYKPLAKMMGGCGRGASTAITSCTANHFMSSHPFSEGASYFSAATPIPNISSMKLCNTLCVAPAVATVRQMQSVLQCCRSAKGSHLGYPKRDEVCPNETASFSYAFSLHAPSTQLVSLQAPWRLLERCR